MTRLVARSIARAGEAGPPPVDQVALDYLGRFLRRKTLRTEGGAELFIDLAQTVSLANGDAFVTETGARVAVAAALEALIEITAAPDALARLAWHIGNRHTPAQIAPGRILIQADPVMAELLVRLGATTRPVTAPFNPEGGAYGQGRTHGHDHGHDHGGPDVAADGG